MRIFLIPLLGAICCGLGCDENPPARTTSVDTAAAETTPAAATKPAASTGTTKRIPLGVIPFMAEVPETWAVQSGLAGRIVLHGVLQSGEIDVLLSNRPGMKPDQFDNLLKEFQRSTTQAAGAATTSVTTRDNMTIVERVEVLGQPGQPPAETLVTFNVKYFVPGSSLDYQVYELNVADLSKEMYDQDAELIRRVLLGLTYDPAATNLGQP